MPIAGHSQFVIRRAWRAGALVPAAHAPITSTALPWNSGRTNRRPWSGDHIIDLRASVPLPGGRWYVTVLAGRERRSADRLAQEGQTSWLRRMMVYMLISSALLWLIVCAIVLAYIAKSAIGLDLFDGASPLHFIYERLFESRLGRPAQDVASALPAASMAFTIFA